MSEVAIRVTNVSKAYRIWRSPAVRLKSIALHVTKRLLPFLWDKCTRAQAKYFHDFYALRDVNLEIRRGEAVGIVGKNGSGKSTLLQIIAGTLAPTHGGVETNGRVAALLELGSGFNPEFTGRENVRMNGAILGLTEREVEERFDEIAAFADIGEFIDRPVKTYSSGMMMRLAFSVQTHVFADIVIVDEALAVGDIRFVQKCMRRLNELLERGTTLLFVTHDPSTVRALCTRAIWLDGGVMKLDADPTRVTREYSHFMAYGETSIAPVLEPVVPVARFAAREVDPPPAGAPGAITRFAFVDVNSGAPALTLQGGELVNLSIEIEARAAMDHPNVAVHLNNRFEQTVVGWNARHHGANIGPLSPGDRRVVEFTCRFPMLLAGDYSLSLGLANGSDELHDPVHIVHGFWTFKVTAKDLQQRNYFFGLPDIKAVVANTSGVASKV